MIRIKSIKKEKKGIAKNFDKLLQKEFYQVLNLQKKYPDSAIEKIFIIKRCLLAINEWVNESLNKKPVTETGGFLLGRYLEKEQDTYDISLETFVPSRKVDFQSPHRLEFGIQTLVDLEEVKDQIGEMTLIGWFHTHPGLTPFLSRKDIELHEHFFQKNYQIAIVLDALEEEWISIAVGRDKEGKLLTERNEKYWIKWKDFTV